jgi:hypothetical protein
MKPIVIIAVSVVCSVVAVLGVLVILDQATSIQAQENYEKIITHEQNMEEAAYNFNKKTCVQMYTDSENCMNYGVFAYYDYRIIDCTSTSLSYEMDCKSREELHFLKSIVPHIETLSYEEKNYFEIDESLIQNLKSDLKQAQIYRDEYLQQKKDMELSKMISISEKCAERDAISKKYAEIMDELRGDYTAYEYNQQKYKAERLSGYDEYDTESNLWALTNCH